MCCHSIEGKITFHRLIIDWSEVILLVECREDFSGMYFQDSLYMESKHTKFGSAGDSGSHQRVRGLRCGDCRRNDGDLWCG